MKKILLTLILFVLIIGSVESAGLLPGGNGNGGGGPLGVVISEPPTQEDPKTIFPGTYLNFSSSVSGGTPSYDYLWVFCSNSDDCNPTISDAANPRNVQFNTTGTYLVVLTVTDDDGTGTSKNDDFTIIVSLAKIINPDPYTGWGANETIPFQGNATSNNAGVTFNYNWDFGDGQTFDDNNKPRGELSIPPDIQYETPGTYTVTLTVTDSTGRNVDSDSIQIYIINPIELEFECYVKGDECVSAPKEIELLRFYRPLNSHARAFDDVNKNLYDYPLCCRSTSVEPISSDSDPGVTGVYAILQTDSDAISVPTDLGGGPHKAGVDNQIIKYYYLDSFIGAGTECQITSGECEDLDGNKTCMYEFYPGEDERMGSHFANCTGGAPHNYPYQMCCEVVDCTNNIDDNLNSWTDCADSSFCLENPCGISSIPKYDECWWYENYETDLGYNFTAFSEPVITPFFGQQYICYDNLVDGYPDCEICVIDGNLEYFFLVSPSDCPSGDPTMDMIDLPQEVLDMEPEGYNPAELYGRCRVYYCSKGQNEITDPLPAFVEDMKTNSEQTRHCCPKGTYWDPTTELCEDFSECYNPDPDGQTPCNASFLTEFSLWLEDATGSFWEEGDFYYPTDCILEYELEAGNTDNVLCCPIWRFHLQTYDYLDIVYYVQE
ncbi:MAG: PKD domain-containing protein [Nanoarchaeota archaeon]|nr:PKD domain-containing protein [DPANN group archaeon]MBL7116512.1 PKD domain-containing protein [Nanoarchaeota archaeon]